MYSKLDDLIALAGLALLTTGVYLWLGLAAAFILLGLVLIYIGARLEPAQLFAKREKQNNGSN